MLQIPDQETVIRRLIEWGMRRESVRAMLLTSTRARPLAQPDLLSDYDVILAVTDVHPFFNDRSWLEDFGMVLVVYRDPIRLELGYERFAYITQYQDGLKIDFSLWSIGLVKEITTSGDLANELEVGYRVILDKDQLTAGLPSPTYQAHIPSPPSEEQYLERIEEFFHEATYVAKHLWRGDLLAAKYNLDKAMKLDNLRLVLEWQVEIEHDWTLKPGAYGRGLQKYLPSGTWQELCETYIGASIEQNWQALFMTIALFRKVAKEVGERLGYSYPHELDERVMRYLLAVKELKSGKTAN